MSSILDLVELAKTFPTVEPTVWAMHSKTYKSLSESSVVLEAVGNPSIPVILDDTVEVGIVEERIVRKPRAFSFMLSWETL